MTIASCYLAIKKYENLKDKIRNIINQLNDCVSFSANVNREVSINYEVDGKNTPIQFRIKTLSDSFDNTSNYLKNSIIVAIDKEIKKLRQLIAQLESNASQVSIGSTRNNFIK